MGAPVNGKLRSTHQIHERSAGRLVSSFLRPALVKIAPALRVRLLAFSQGLPLFSQALFLNRSAAGR